jgi:hypothetical protein
MSEKHFVNSLKFSTLKNIYFFFVVLLQIKNNQLTLF